MCEEGIRRVEERRNSAIFEELGGRRDEEEMEETYGGEEEKSVSGWALVSWREWNKRGEGSRRSKTLKQSGKSC